MLLFRFIYPVLLQDSEVSLGKEDQSISGRCLLHKELRGYCFTFQAVFKELNKRFIEMQKETPRCEGDF